MSKENLETIRGLVKTITFHNEANGYTVAKIILEGSKKLVAATGNIKRLSEGETVVFKGYWADDPKYGRQFKFSAYESVIPSSVEGIKNFLSSSYIKGIGKVKAESIVNTFGAETIDVLENHPERLKEVPGLTPKLLKSILSGWGSHREIRDIMIFLRSYDISETYAAKIYNTYGPETVDILRRNPYRLIRDIAGIGFIKADGIAQNIGISPESPERIQAGIIYILDEFADKGNIFAPLEKLLELAATRLDVDADKVIPQLEYLKETASVTVEDSKVFKSELYWYEKELCQRIKQMCSSKPDGKIPPAQEIESIIDLTEKEMGLTFADLQKEAIRKAAHSNIVVITGGPGTGKTTIVKGIISLLKKLNLTVLLCAPTGRAAKRLTETTSVEAKTIHRFLEYNPRTGRFSKNQGDPINSHAVILDEASMVDTLLMTEFMRALTPYTRLIIVGDIDQLPAIGPGNVLRDIIVSGTVPTVRLDVIFRQAASSRIVSNAHRINTGKMPVLDIDSNENFFFMKMNNPDEVSDKIVELVAKRLPNKYGFDPISDIQVISPMHKGKTGVENLNLILQAALNPSVRKDREIRFGNNIFRAGDKVMQIKNNYDNMVFNGDIGRVVKVMPQESKMLVRFDEIVEYSSSSMEELATAYAISVHKSQGSEFRCVVIPLTTQHFIMLKRNLIYTAITRAKDLVVILGEVKALAIAVNNENVSERYTTLAERLSGKISDI